MIWNADRALPQFNNIQQQNQINPPKQRQHQPPNDGNQRLNENQAQIAGGLAPVNNDNGNKKNKIYNVICI